MSPVPAARGCSRPTRRRRSAVPTESSGCTNSPLLAGPARCGRRPGPGLLAVGERHEVGHRAVVPAERRRGVHRPWRRRDTCQDRAGSIAVVITNSWQGDTVVAQPGPLAVHGRSPHRAAWSGSWGRSPGRRPWSSVVAVSTDGGRGTSVAGGRGASGGGRRRAGGRRARVDGGADSALVVAAPGAAVGWPRASISSATPISAPTPEDARQGAPEVAALA